MKLQSFTDKELFNRHFKVVPELVDSIMSEHIDLRRSDILDFGCDLGVKTFGYATQWGGASVVGCDIHDTFRSLPAALSMNLGSETLPANLSFHRLVHGEQMSNIFKVDCIIAWSVVEHIRRPLLGEILIDMRETLNPGGFVFIQTNPLYFSPWGHHLRHRVSDPWLHLLVGVEAFERMLMENEEVSEDAKKRELGVFRTLNQLTMPELLRAADESGFEIVESMSGRCRLEPPLRLLEEYDQDVLCTEGCNLVLRKKCK